MGTNVDLRVTVVILNYNCADVTLECVESLKKTEYPELDIIVVDNCSPNGSFDQLEQGLAGSGVELIRNSRNGGFSEGTNIGMLRAMELGAEWIHLLNPDTVVAPDFYRRLSELTARKPEIRAVGALGLYTEDKSCVWFGGGYFDWIKGRGECRHQGKNSRELDLGRMSGPTQFLTCACLMVHIEAVERIGLLDTRYFLGGEEWDYSRRLARAGYALHFEASMHYWHHVTATHVKYSPKYLYNGFRTKLLFMRDQKPWLYYVWRPLFNVYTALLARRRFRNLDPSIDSGEVSHAIRQAIKDHRRYGSIELTHLQQFLH